MGSSQSQPGHPSRRRQQIGRTRPHDLAPPFTPSSQSTPASSQRSPSESRFASLRRLSGLGRRDSQKRDRATSPNADGEPHGAKQKKRRVESPGSPPSTVALLPSQIPVHSSPAPITVPDDITRTPRTGLSAPLQHGSLPTSPGPPVLPTLPVPICAPQSGSISPPLLSPPIDPLLPDRLETLDTIRNTLGPDWSTNTHDPVTTEERLQRITTTLDRIERIRSGHRDSLPVSESQNTSYHPDTSSASSGPSAATETSSTRITDRVCSLLGISNSGSSQANHQARSEDIETDSLADASVDDLQERIERARADLADVQRQLETARAVNEGLADLSRPQTRGSEAVPGEESADNEVDNGAGQAGPQRRIPAGAVLVIQGLAQTHALDRSATQRENRRTRSWIRNEPSSERPGHGRARSSSDSHVSSASAGAGEQSDTDGVNELLEAQARMISNLLTVAAEATAQTLLVPPTPPPEPRSPSNALSNVIDRLRPQRRRQSPVEAALGDHLRNALRARNRVDDTPALTGETSPDAAAAGDSGNGNGASPEFQQFLEGLQVDLVGAVRQFATPPNEPNEAAGSDSSSSSAAAADEGAHAANPARSADTIRSEAADDVAVTENPRLETRTASETEGNSGSGPDATPIPAFHYQLGQNRPDDASRRYGVSGGTDGQPRRLNFFRAHLFPPVQADEPGLATGTDDPNGMVPCIFIGVRSLNHDPSLTTDELVQHPNFPFLDGQAPSGATAGGNAEESTVPATPSTSDLSSSSLPARAASDDRSAAAVPPHLATTSTSTTNAPERRSLRERALSLFAPSRQAPPPPPRPLHTYLVFVIGGHYPRSHPILSIPSLLTGDPLTDEEMVLIGELMGPGKPPTASKEDIESAGLQLVDASEIARLGEEGVVLSICVDRCLVCLGDYEPGEECRVLKCRHAYHRECVDEWLSKGRNSCPACRSEAVETKQSGAAASETTSNPTTSPGVNGSNA